MYALKGKKMKRNTIAVLLVVSLLSLTACSSNTEQKDTPKSSEVLNQTTAAPKTETGTPVETSAPKEETKETTAATTTKADGKTTAATTTAKAEVTTPATSQTTKPAGNTGTVKAGVLSSQSGHPSFSASASFEANRDKLNAYLEKISGYQFVYDGIASVSDERPSVAQLIYNDDGRYGLHVFEWREDKNESAAMTKKINAVLEAIYFISGDKEFATSLWKLIDGVYLNGTANTKEQGFESVSNEGSIYVFKKNGFEVEWDNGDTYAMFISKVK